MIKEIIFDLDGTLVDSLDTYIKIGNQIAEKYGYEPLDNDKIKELLKLPMKMRIKELGIPAYKIPVMGLELLNSYSKYAADALPAEGIKEMLETLKNDGYGLSIVSSNSVTNIQSFLEGNNLNLFNHIHSSKGLFGKHTTIKKLITRLNVEKDEVIYIGDEQRDVEACKKIGIQVISVLWGFDSLELIQKTQPDFIVSRPGEIINIIRSI